MKRQEFIDIIDDAMVEVSNLPCGICYALDRGYEKKENRTPLLKAFKKIFKGGSYHSVWFGPVTYGNVPVRLDALVLFREYCLSEKLYKEF